MISFDRADNVIAQHTTADGTLIRIVKHDRTAYAYEIQVSHVRPYLLTWDRCTDEQDARTSANAAWKRFTRGETMVPMVNG